MSTTPNTQMSPRAAKIKPEAAHDRLIWAAVGLAGAALATAVYLTIHSGTAQEMIFVYRVTLLLLFFAISTVSAAIFSAKASLDGSFLGLGLKLGGPAVLWIVTLILFTKFYPEDSLTKQALEGRIQQDWNARQSDSWSDYAGWKARLGDDFADVLGNHETDTLRNLFWNVYYLPPGERLEDVQVTTLFLYLSPKYMMKLQRIQGHRKATNRRFRLYYGGKTSKLTTASNSVLLVGQGDPVRVKDAYFDGGESRPEQNLEQTDINCLIISSYDDQVVENGEYVTTNMRDYAKNHRGALRFGIAAFRPLGEVRSWWLNARTVSDDDELLPLAFREIKPNVEQNLEAVEKDLKPWLKLLDDTLQQPPADKPWQMVQEQLKRAAAESGVETVKASELLNSSAFKGRWSLEAPEAEDVVLTMFLWQH